MAEIQKILAVNLKRLIDQRGFPSLQAFSDASGTEYVVLLRTLKGKNWPQMKNILAWAQTLKVSDSELFHPHRPAEPIVIEHSVEECHRRVGEALKFRMAPGELAEEMRRRKEQGEGRDAAQVERDSGPKKKPR